MDLALNVELHVGKWNHYMQTRQGTYEFRARTRYKAVAEKLIAMGLSDSHLVVDIGAGSCQFDHYLRTALGWRGRYLPIDAVIDGTDLETWTPKAPADFTVAIEVLEHLHNFDAMRFHMQAMSTLGAVVTTPNPERVNVIACDPTHVSVIQRNFLEAHGWEVEARSFFHVPEDTLLASYTRRKAA